MPLGFDKDKFLEQWRGSIGVVRGEEMWDPFTQKFVRIDRGQTSIGDDAYHRLSLPQPNPLDDRLLHIQALEEAGIIDAQQAAEAKEMVLSEAA